MLISTRYCNRWLPQFRFWKWNRNSQMSRARSHAPPAVVSRSHDPPNMLCHRLLRHQNIGATQQGRKEGWPFVNFNRKEMARNTEQFCCIAAERNFWIAVLFDDWLLIVGGRLRIKRRLQNRSTAVREFELFSDKNETVLTTDWLFTRTNLMAGIEQLRGCGEGESKREEG